MHDPALGVSCQVCDKCGNHADDYARYCPNCGYSLCTLEGRLANSGHIHFNKSAGVTGCIFVCCILFFCFGLAARQHEFPVAPSGNSYQLLTLQGTGIQNNSVTGQVDSPDHQQTWVTTQVIAGSGIGRTEPFRVNSNQWRISWKLAPTTAGTKYIHMHLFDKDDRFCEMFGNTSQPGGFFIHHGQGIYYLGVTSVSSWAITIEELH